MTSEQGTLNFAFLDESGEPSLSKQSRYLVVAALVTADPRAVALVVKRARRALGQHSPVNELKARFTASKVIQRLLSALAEEKIRLYVLAVDKQQYHRSTGEQLYRQSMAQVVRWCVTHSSHLRVILDKRYTNANQHVLLEEAIRKAISDVPEQVVIIEPQESTGRAELQAADFVAWAFGQKYERGNETFSCLLAERTVKEEVWQ